MLTRRRFDAQSCSARSLLGFSVVVSESAQTSNRCLGGHSRGGSELPRTTCDLAACLLAFPDADGFSFDAFLLVSTEQTYLAAEGTDVLGSLSDFKLFDNLSEGSTVASSELAADSSLLCSLCHYVYCCLI